MTATAYGKSAPGRSADQPISVEGTDERSAYDDGMHGARSGPPQDLLARIVADLADELDRPAADVHVDSIEPVTWRDGSLGCPEPGMFYTQALVRGFRVILVVDDQRYDYRTGAGGIFRRCDVPPGGSGTTDRPAYGAIG